MSTPRTVRVTVDGITTTLRALSGRHYAIGDPELTSVLRVPRLPDGSAWCTVDVHSRPGAEVTAELAPGPGRPRGAAEARRTVDIRFRLTEAEAERLGLTGEDRHERARERVTDSARAEALTATLERAQQALRAILDATGCSYSPPPDEWPRAAVEEVRRVVAGFGGAP